MTSLGRRWGAWVTLVALLCILFSNPLVPVASAAVTGSGTTTSTRPSTASGKAQSGTKAAATHAPAVQARAAILMNLDDGRVLYARKADTRRPMASTTKIMTGLLALETLPLDKKVKASAKAAATGESAIGLAKGEVLTVEELMKALMIKSANDAAVDLAEASAGSVGAFVAQMNVKAKALGLKNTHFQNPHGLDAKSHYSSARDLATLTREAMKNAEFRKLVSTKTATIPWPGHTYDRSLKNHNGLLFTASYVNGVKTGFTLPAMFCVVATGSKNGVNLVGVVLGEPSIEVRDDDMKALLSWGFGQYRPVVLAEKGQPRAALDVPYHPESKLRLVTADRLVTTLYVGDKVRSSVTSPTALDLPVAKGTVLGKVAYTAGGKPAGQVDLVADQTIEQPSLSLKIAYFWDRFVKWVEGVL